jgi:hypothetical protein
VKQTQTTAWDEAWRQTECVHLVGCGLPQTEAAKVVARAMGELSKMRLPLKAISCIGYAVLKAYDCGRFGSIAESPAKEQVQR